MNLADLEALGAFVSARPVRRQVTWKQSEALDGAHKEVTVDAWILPLSFGLIDTLSVPGVDAQSQKAVLISRAVVDENGKSVLTYEQAYRLKPSLAIALYAAIAEVNRLPKLGNAEGDDEEDLEKKD